MVTAKTVTLHIFSSTKEWSFLNYHVFVAKWDENKKSFGCLEHHGHVGNGYVTETFFPEFTYEEFKEIATARSVTMALGSTEFELPYPNRAHMRAFVDYFDESPGSDVDTPSGKVFYLPVSPKM